MRRVHTKTSPPVFISSVFYKTVNFELFKTQTKTKYKISIRDPAIWDDFVEDCLKSTEKTPFSEVKMKFKLLNFDNEISYF